VRCTVYQRIYEKFSFRTRRRGQNGRILLHSRAMSGSAGLSPSRNRKPEGSTLSEYARNLRKECAGLVAGQAVLTAEVKDGGIRELQQNLVSQLKLISGLEDRGRPGRGGAHRRWWKGLWKNRRQHDLRTTGETQRGASTRPEAPRWFYHLSKADGKS